MKHTSSDLVNSIIDSSGVGQLGPGFYVTPEQQTAEYFAKYFNISGKGKPQILKLFMRESIFNQLKKVKLS